MIIVLVGPRPKSPKKPLYLNISIFKRYTLLIIHFASSLLELTMAEPRKLQKSLRSYTPSSKPQKLYIFVMGLTGAGKSTFISTVTEDDTIPIGTAADVEGGKGVLSFQ